jgi:hypothetical protein
MASIRGIKLAIIALALLNAANAGEPARIDGSTETSAETSWNTMVAEASEETKPKLQAAFMKILSWTLSGKHLDALGYHTASENPWFYIKDKLGGLSAEQIIEQANRTPASE